MDRVSNNICRIYYCCYENFMASQCKIVKSNSNDGGRKGERVYLPLNYESKESRSVSTTLTGIRTWGRVQYVCGFYGSPAAATSVV